MDTIFYIASKLLSFAFSPIIWIFSLLIITTFTKNAKRKKYLLIATISIFYLLSNSFLADEAMRWWEMPPVKLEKLNTSYDYVVILGGMMSYYDSNTNQIGMNRSIDRLLQGIKLQKKGKAKKILISGGDGSLLKSIGKEAEIIKTYLQDIGLDDDCIKIESNSQNTYENAKYSAQILRNDSAKTVLLVTSAFHMRRALACFHKQGIYPDYYPAERYSGKRKYIFDHLLIPDLQAIEKWDKLIHEWVGYLMYKIMGYA
ncbi:MAG: YdcF family protein [Bacteroidales bacterium]|nr:YdcF family protein [Bacteroidales bacterium]